MTMAPTGAGTALASLRGPLLVGAAGVGVAALLRFRDPHESGTYGFCPFESLTGQPCPGCGGLRAVNDLTRGDVAAAVSSNALAVTLVVAAAVLWVVWLVRRWRGDRQAQLVVLSTRALLVVVPLIVVFGVLRVTPWGSWLAP
jgi:hypothetical protein